MLKRSILLLFVMILLVFYSGCINLTIKVDVDYPGKLFTQTQKKIAKIHKADPRRKGEVSNLNVLVYAGDERKLISFSIPKTTIETTTAADFLKEFDKKGLSDKVGQVDLEKLKDLDRIGPGLIIEVEVDEKDGFVHVLVWLD